MADCPIKEASFQKQTYSFGISGPEIGTLFIQAQGLLFGLTAIE